MGAFFNLRAASTDDEDGLTVLHEVNIAKVITAKEIVFNIGLSPVELLIELILRVTRTQRCAGEGEFIFGLIKRESWPDAARTQSEVSIYGFLTVLAACARACRAGRERMVPPMT
jgi:hypothetical protein